MASASTHLPTDRGPVLTERAGEAELLEQRVDGVTGGKPSKTVAPLEEEQAAAAAAALDGIEEAKDELIAIESSMSPMQWQPNWPFFRETWTYRVAGAVSVEELQTLTLIWSGTP